MVIIKSQNIKTLVPALWARKGKAIMNKDNVNVKEVKLTDEDIVDKLDEAGIYTTEYPEEAIYVLRDGTLIDGSFDYGCRGEDHVCIESIFDGIDRYTDGFWEKMFKATEAVMLIPENKQAVFPDWLTPTRWQWKVINELDYELMSDY